jgi:hypothetical protein
VGATYHQHMDVTGLSLAEAILGGVIAPGSACRPGKAGPGLSGRRVMDVSRGHCSLVFGLPPEQYSE